MKNKQSYRGMDVYRKTASVEITEHLSDNGVKVDHKNIKNRLNNEVHTLINLLRTDQKELENRVFFANECIQACSSQGITVVSTVNLNINMNNSIDIYCHELDKVRQVREIVKDIAEYNSVLYGANATPPFISYTTKGLKYNVHIYFCKGYSFKIEHMKNVLDKYPVARGMVLLLEHILSERNLFSNSISLKEYDIVILCECFLNAHPLVQSKSIDLEQSLGVLFMDLLELYSKDINHSQVAIDPKNGKFVRRKLTTQYLSLIDPVNNRETDNTMHMFRMIEDLFLNLFNGMNVLLLINPKLPMTSFWVKLKKNTIK
ncbi:hypothetical protein NEOKW01_1772 [Nematocida sp. AWRm80]|nr:hypothetical protein NEOKW01_1772 [Nematocida sp. AWRm80]